MTSNRVCGCKKLVNKLYKETLQTCLCGWTVWHGSSSFAKKYVHLWLEHNTFSNADILQGSVATCLSCGEIFSCHFPVNLLADPSVKVF